MDAFIEPVITEKIARTKAYYYATPRLVIGGKSYRRDVVQRPTAACSGGVADNGFSDQDDRANFDESKKSKVVKIGRAHV